MLSTRTRTLAASALAATTLLTALGWITFQKNLNAYRLKKGRQLRRRRKRRGKAAAQTAEEGGEEGEERYLTWCRQFCDDWAGEELVVALEAMLFPKGGSFAVHKASPRVREPAELVYSISFAGGGFRTISYVGMLIYLEKRSMIAVGQTRFYGASLGALVACGMVLGETNPEARHRLICGMLEYVCEVHADWPSMWGICGIATRRVLEHALPEDVSTLNGRLFVAVTCLTPFPHSQLVSDFKSKQDLIETLLASQFIPGWTHGLLPAKLWRRGLALDGGIFDNIPTPAVGRPDGTGRKLVGLLSRAALLETFALPSLRRQDGHFTCRDAHAPWAQVCSPVNIQTKQTNLQLVVQQID